MTLGKRKPFFKTDKNPGAGQYDTEKSDRYVRFKYTPDVKMRTPSKKSKKQEKLPGPYFEPKPFGHDTLGNLQFGKRYLQKTDKTPAPGQYQIDRGLKLTRARSVSALIERPVEKPESIKWEFDQVFDNKLVHEFGKDTRKMTIGKKYESVIV